MSAASQKGARFEQAFVDWLRVRLGNDLIERRTKNGIKDRGDVTGVKTLRGARVVIELKNHARLDLSGWLREAHTEAGNDDAPIGVVVFKRTGKGKPADQYVLMDAETLAALLEGGPDDRPAVALAPRSAA